MSNLLAKLESGSNVAVVTLFGSLCPITKGHTQAFIEARRLLLGEECSGGGVVRPDGLEDFEEVLGFVTLNDDSHVGRKLAARGEALTLGYEERIRLVRLATSDVPWIGVEDWEGESYRELKGQFPKLNFVHFSMNGADDVLRYEKWRYAGPRNRILTMGRPGYTECLLEVSSKRRRLNPAHFVMGPELPDVSSTEARAALARGDREALGRLLHANVAEWCLEHAR